MDGHRVVCRFSLTNFNSWVITIKKSPKPVILFICGHSTHMSMDAAEYCSATDIVLYCLLPHATHILQAAVIGIFSSLKSCWSVKVRVWQLGNLGQVPTKKFFPAVFKKAWQLLATLQNAVKAFKQSGLFPLNINNIDQSKLSP